MNKKVIQHIGLVGVTLIFSACNSLQVQQREAISTVPISFNDTIDSSLQTINSSKLNWKEFFTDQNLQALIQQALTNNQELAIVKQEIERSKNEIKIRKGEYLPTVGLRVGGGVDKVSRYTNIGAMEATTDILPGKKMPEPVPDLGITAVVNWEVDIWGRLHKAKQAAVNRYLATIEGKNFMVTTLVAEIAQSYYELLALDAELRIVNKNIEIQNNALEIVKKLKDAARTNELAVKRFEAQVLKTTALQYAIQQKVVETEGRINFLVGRFPQKVARNTENFDDLVPNQVYAGVPSEMVSNRPDIKEAEYNVIAAKLDIKVAKARFYPTLGITVGIGYQAFDPSYIFKPESLLYNLAGDLIAPIVNRNAIKAEYQNASLKQVQAVITYEQTILNAFIEVRNQINKIDNLQKTYDLKYKEVETLNESVEISNKLFKSARADYMEVLLTQREALEAKFELIETKMEQLSTSVAVYKALGGGWN